MDPEMPMTTPSVPPPQVAGAEIVRIAETHRTVRFGMVCGTILVGMGILVYGVIQIANNPSWWKLAAALVTGLIGPSLVIKVSIELYTDYVKKNHSRTTELEKKILPDRSSSNDRTREVKDKQG